MGMDQYIYYGRHNQARDTWSVIDRTEKYYYRKFYSLHKWIFKHCVCHDGTPDEYGFCGDKYYIADSKEDNCVFVPVKKSKWEELLHTLDEVLEAIKKAGKDLDNIDIYAGSAIRKLFPGGWFDSDTDEWFYKAVKDLRKDVKSIISTSKWSDDGFIAQDKVNVPDKDIVAKMKVLREKCAERDSTWVDEHNRVYKQLEAEFNKSSKTFSDEYSSAGFSNYWRKRAFVKEYYNRMDKWMEDNGYIGSGDIYETLGITESDICTVKAIGYYA